jgi:2-methylcitrate dehydratase PrpD
VRSNVHSHGTWGTIGTAVVVARLGGAGELAIRAAVNLAASMSPANTWTPALEGATIRNLYPGRSAWQGILAVDLLGCGFTGLDDAPSDVYGTILADAFDPEAAVTDLESGWRIQQNYFKLHACCRYNHYALEALGTLQRRERLRPEQVASVHVTTIPFGVRMASPAPASMLAAKFSIPWAVAAALVRGDAGLGAFDAGALGDARIRALAGRVTVAADPAMTPRRADQPTARLRVTLADGRALEAEASVVRGDHAAPVPAAEVIDKFLALAGPVLGAERARAAADCALVADGLKDVRDLTALLTT